ncbi:hypothetical protein Lal_00038003 [Lupinus albus]|nr:hypothetical protein Lal_00038003 [Lupinus albus]
MKMVNSFNMKRAAAGLRRINLDGLRWRVFDAKGQMAVAFSSQPPLAISKILPYGKRCHGGGSAMAELRVLGRLASQIATVVQGKDKPTYTPNRDDGDMCVVLNAKDICVTGRKLTDKVYYWHTGQVLCIRILPTILSMKKLWYIGHLKKRTLEDQMAKDPTDVIRKAVLRMLPRNKLRDDRDRKLRIFPGSEHPFVDRPLEPYVMPPRTVREMRPRARRAMIREQKKALLQQQNNNDEKKKGKKREAPEESA